MFGNFYCLIKGGHDDLRTLSCHSNKIGEVRRKKGGENP